MADITEIAAYYTSLLIIQYNGLPKAAATISLLTSTLLAQGVAIDVGNAYNVEADLGPTAVGVQLDVIGKYVGVNRYYSSINYGDYTALVPYNQHATLPTSPPAFGLERYSTFNGDYDYNGTLVYDDIITSTNALSDVQFLTLIQLAILNNNCNYSFAQISENIFSILGNGVVPETAGFMSLVYFFRTALTTLLSAVIAKGLLPRPMGVAALAVTGIVNNMFAFTNYAGYKSPWGYGFSTYANYGTLAGQSLTYSMIQGV